MKNLKIKNKSHLHFFLHNDLNHLAESTQTNLKKDKSTFFHGHLYLYVYIQDSGEPLEIV